MDIYQRSRHLHLFITVSRVIQGEGEEKDINKVYMKHEEAKPKHFDKFKGYLLRLPLFGSDRSLSK